MSALSRVWVALLLAAPAAPLCAPKDVLWSLELELRPAEVRAAPLAFVEPRAGAHGGTGLFAARALAPGALRARPPSALRARRRGGRRRRRRSRARAPRARPRPRPRPTTAARARWPSWSPSSRSSGSSARSPAARPRALLRYAAALPWDSDALPVAWSDARLAAAFARRRRRRRRRRGDCGG